mmetsp:Transcript_31742/g.94732  ORF Transcript_31742/g.94732 Transcript_31742/m.94732 type:complete len:286 (+) Transcript_31742:442-1299(+)
MLPTNSLMASGSQPRSMLPALSGADACSGGAAAADACAAAAALSALRCCCSALSIHLTTIGFFMPSKVCTSCSPAIAAHASSRVAMVTSPHPRPQPFWRLYARNSTTDTTVPKWLKIWSTSSSLAVRSTLPKNTVAQSSSTPSLASPKATSAASWCSWCGDCDGERYPALTPGRSELDTEPAATSAEPVSPSRLTGGDSVSDVATVAVEHADARDSWGLATKERATRGCGGPPAPRCDDVTAEEKQACWEGPLASHVTFVAPPVHVRPSPAPQPALRCTTWPPRS